MLDLQPFLTAYDPSDLPGSSVDPLGFDRGYELLAEKILPGLTNVASRPRYLSAYCAALVIAEEDGALRGTERDRKAQKLAFVLQLERLWVLSCLLGGEGEPMIDDGGIRGIRYVQAYVKRMRSGSDGDFRLLLQQARYGMLGIYGSVADNLKLVARSEIELTEPGRRLGEAFIRDTKMPEPIRAAVVKPRSVPRELLASWGRRAHVNAAYGAAEATGLADAMDQDPTRQRMGSHLRAHPLHTAEPELNRLARISVALSGTLDRDLAEATRAILAYEEAYRALLLVFFRVLWFCQRPPFSFDLAYANTDGVHKKVFSAANTFASKLDAAFSEGSTANFQKGLDRAGDVRQFVASAAACASAAELVEVVLARHRNVLGARLAGGRPKMPWVEVINGTAKPTLTAAQQMQVEFEGPEAILVHPYRTSAADRFYASTGEAA